MNTHDTTAALFESADQQFEEIFGGAVLRPSRRKRPRTSTSKELEVQVEGLKQKLIQTEKELSEAKKKIQNLREENQKLRESKANAIKQPPTNENAEDLRRQNAKLLAEVKELKSRCDANVERIVRYKPNNPYDAALNEHNKKKANTSSKN
ncbi:hypothetical protein M3Y94_00130300 [Aphelenchoides besseyi]|nr:hypothetical protein M3Y94_00130300 [Aphelenchoides besseyi]KAI6237347.1 hypothetical protein M3Y95_00255400 [Aphelenchoides besseyi]